MKSKRRNVKWIVVALSSVAVFLLAGMCGLVFLYTRWVDQARAAYAPPTVYVTQPASGSSALAGSQLAVSATAWGDVPISRAG